MTEAVRIRPAAEADLPELVELLRQLFELEQAVSYTHLTLPTKA